MNAKAKQLQMVKMMTESLVIPEFRAITIPTGYKEVYKRFECSNGTSWAEFERKCMQIRKEMKRLY